VQHGVRPRGGRRVEIDVAVDAIGDAARAERREAFIGNAARLAELRVARVAEREHGKAQALEARRLATEEEIEEGARAIGRVAVAVGARDEIQQPLLRELARGVVACRDGPGRDAACVERGDELLGDATAVAGV